MKAGLREGGGKSFPRRGRPGKFCRVDREKIAGDAAALEGGGSTPLFLPTVRGRSGVIGAAGSQSCVEPQHSTDRAAAPRAGSSATVVGVSPPVHDVDTTRVAAEGTHAATGVCREAARRLQASFQPLMKSLVVNETTRASPQARLPVQLATFQLLVQFR